LETLGTSNYSSNFFVDQIVFPQTTLLLLPDLKNDPGGEKGNKWGNVEDSNKENKIFKLTQ
jgi:hypothetical protein